jgi:hypothetical protein
MTEMEDYVLIEEGMRLDSRAGVGQEFEHHGVMYRVMWDASARPVVFHLTSYFGSIGATHYYGELVARDLSLLVVKGDAYHKEGQIKRIVGRCEGRPRFSDSFQVGLNRQLSAEEIAKGGRYDPHRWEVFEPGDWTHCFDTRGTAIARAREVFAKLYVIGGWRLMSRLEALGQSGGWEGADDE